MADNVNVVINFADAVDYKGRSSDGPAALLPFDGIVPAKLRKFRTHTNDQSGNHVLTLIMDVDQEGVGGTLYAPIAVSGVVRSGPNEGQKNVHRFFEFLESAGWTKAQISEASAAGASMAIDKILNDLIAKGVRVYPNTKAEEYRGKRTSKVQGFSTQAYFEQAMIAGTAQQPRDDTAGAGTAPRNGAVTGARVDPLAGVMG